MTKRWRWVSSQVPMNSGGPTTLSVVREVDEDACWCIKLLPCCAAQMDVAIKAVM